MTLSSRLRGLEVPLAIVLAVAVRLIVARNSYNYDFSSFRLVAEIVDRGGNVYASTHRYNYGPIWFWVLDFLNQISKPFENQETAFRYCIAAFLSLVDLALFALLWRRYGRLPALLALISPIAILISGHHGQFDNFALLLGMSAVMLYEAHEHQQLGPSGLTRGRLAAFVLLGLSLMVKHILFMFPLWLAARDRSWRAQIWAIGVPCIVFASGFLPYVDGGLEGILVNFIGYRSAMNTPLWNVIIRPIAGGFIPPMWFFLAALASGAFLTKRWRAMDALLMYTLVLVSFSPSLTNQYLAIVVPAIAVFHNVLFQLYTIVATGLIIGSPDGLGFVSLARMLPTDRRGFPRYELPIAILFMGVLWVIARYSTWRRDLSAVATADLTVRATEDNALTLISGSSASKPAELAIDSRRRGSK